MNYSLLIILLALLLLVLLFVRYKQGGASSAAGKTAKTTKSSVSRRRAPAEGEKAADSGDWMDQVNQTVAESEHQDWEWGSSGSNDAATTSVSAQEVDPLTEYQVYKQFGYEDKAAAALAGYLDGL